MQKYLKELQPSKFEDLIAMNALYRPGPMDYIPSFIAISQKPDFLLTNFFSMLRLIADNEFHKKRGIFHAHDRQKQSLLVWQRTQI